MSMNIDIKKLLEGDRLIIGAEETLKGLRAGTIQRVFVAENVKESLLSDLKVLAGLGDVEIVEVGIPNDELGTVCRKPFAISVLGEKSQ